MVNRTEIITSRPAARFRLSQGVLSAENSAGESTIDCPPPFGRTLCPACSSLCEIHADLPTCRQAITAIPFCSAKRTRPPTMSTIERVDPELRDALALWPQVSLTAETLT